MAKRSKAMKSMKKVTSTKVKKENANAIVLVARGTTRAKQAKTNANEAKTLSILAKTTRDQAKQAEKMNVKQVAMAATQKAQAKDLAVLLKKMQHMQDVAKQKPRLTLHQMLSWLSKYLVRWTRTDSDTDMVVVTNTRKLCSSPTLAKALKVDKIGWVRGFDDVQKNDRGRLLKLAPHPVDNAVAIQLDRNGGIICIRTNGYREASCHEVEEDLLTRSEIDPWMIQTLKNGDESDSLPSAPRRSTQADGPVTPMKPARTRKRWAPEITETWPASERMREEKR